MKILLINYRYYEGGGAERYLFNVKDLLEKKGHTVIPFSLRFKMNRPSPYEKYFADPPGGDEDSFYYKDVKKNAGSILSLLGRQFYSKHVYDRLVQLIRDSKPDIAYVLHFLHKMSPSVIDACADHKVPVMVRISDFALICPKNNFYRENTICESCQKDLWHSVRFGCVQNSRAASLVNYAAYQFNYWRKFHRRVSGWVCPSRFTIDRYLSNPRFSHLTFHHVPTFVDPALLEMGRGRSIPRQQRRLIYWGRLSQEKGIDTLLQAIKIINSTGSSIKLSLIGQGDKNYTAKIKSFIENNNRLSVALIPFQEKKELFDKAVQADAAVVPSVWYDNMPNSLIEAQALGMPVIASDIGSLRELVNDGINGYKFKPGDATDLAQNIGRLYDNEETFSRLFKTTQEWAEKYYSSEKHYEALLLVFQNHLKGRSVS